MTAMKNIIRNLVDAARELIKKEHTDETAFDRKYQINTAGYLDINDYESDAGVQARVHDYHGTPVRILRKLIRKLPAKDHGRMAFVDYGSGLGRCLFVALEEGFGSVIGIEYCKAFFQQGQQNLDEGRLLEVDRQRIQLLNIDAVDFAPPPVDSVFFLFNPFDAETTAKVAKGIARSHQGKPRDLYVIYYNPWYRSAFDDHSSYELMEDGKFGQVWRIYRYFPYAIYRVVR